LEANGLLEGRLMTMVDNLKSILARQKELLSGLETEIATIEANDLVTENQILKTELKKSQESLEEKKADHLKISEENKNLRNALYEQLYNEKTHILNTVMKRMDVYYKSNLKGEINRLSKQAHSGIKEMQSLRN